MDIMTQPENPAQTVAGTSKEDRSARIAVTVFPLMILAAFAAAMIAPAAFKSFAGGTNYALGVITFGMGLTLSSSCRFSRSPSHGSSGCPPRSRSA